MPGRADLRTNSAYLSALDPVIMNRQDATRVTATFG